MQIIRSVCELSTGKPIEEFKIQNVDGNSKRFNWSCLHLPCVQNSKSRKIQQLIKSRTRAFALSCQTGYFSPARYGMGVWPDGKIVGASSAPSASSRKCPNVRKCTLFSKWTCQKFPEILICQKEKPLREHPNIG